MLISFNGFKLTSIVLYIFMMMQGKGMSSMPERSHLDAINQNCYNHCYQIWDRFPFPDTLSKWIIHYHDRSLGQSVLDIGSGTGQLAQWLKGQGFHVLGIDPSPMMIKQCQLKGIHCLLTTFQEYQETQPFSLILSILSFIHIPRNEWPAQLAKVANLLLPKGLFILAVIEGRGEEIQEASSGYPRFFAYFTREEIIKLTHKDFELIDFVSYPAPKSGYLLFAFRKR
jgi:2-polyprenyl-3-methyl-5-hydroxy-6-metoxy-1,4-benzoquinol methylase